MPVSPQDFELYSRMTGAPMPSDAMSRMQMAPDVYKFTKDFARKPNLLEKTGNLVKTVGKIGLMGLGEGYRQSQANEQRALEEQLRNKADVMQSEAVTMENPVEEVASDPLTSSEKAEIAKQKTADLRHSQKMEQMAVAKKDALDLLAAKVKTVQQPTTSDAFGQDLIENQTADNVIDKKMEQGSQMADTVPNVAEVLSESQDSAPVDVSFPVGDARRNMRPVEEIEKNLQDDMETAGLTRIGGPEGGVGKNQLARFLSQKGLDQALLGAVGERMTPEPRIGDNSPLIDHPDLPGGEDDINLPSGTNTSSTENLSDFYQDMRKMEALERIAEKSPSTKQIALGEMNKSREGFMAQDGPNKPAYDAKQRILEKTRKKMSRDEYSKIHPDFKSDDPNNPRTVVFNEETKGTKSVPVEFTDDIKSPSVSSKSDDFMAQFVEGAQSDIVRGARGNKSLGITRIPATNGDAQVGFVLANKPLDQSPTTATTYGFGVAPGAESLLDNQLNKDSFSDYMKRGMSEAKQGKKRKAGEIFEYLPQSKRVIGGTASLGDIVM